MKKLFVLLLSITYTVLPTNEDGRLPREKRIPNSPVDCPAIFLHRNGRVIKYVSPGLAIVSYKNLGTVWDTDRGKTFYPDDGEYGILDFLFEDAKRD